MSLADIRREYLGQPLSETESDADPFAQFARWFEQVRELEPDPDGDGARDRDARRPSLGPHRAAQGRGRARLRVLHELPAAARRASWTAPAAPACCSTGASLERQVRIDGPVEKVIGRRVRRLLRDASDREPLERLRLEAERGRSRAARRWSRASTPRASAYGDDDPAAGVVGRLSRDPRRVRVLAGTAKPAARSAALPATGRRAGGAIAWRLRSG